jgi:gamma-glutamyltranspeptidase/glutathione hydrolase
MTRAIATRSAAERITTRVAHPGPHIAAPLLVALAALAALAATARAQGAVAADDPRATAVGAAVLADGGSAADAAVATALALGVVNPTSSGIGGGGFAIVYDAATGQLHAFDFREVAPAALDPSDFVHDGAVDPQRARRGGLAVGVPGEVAGLTLLTARFGRLSWRRLVAPAMRLARDGSPTSAFMSQAAARVVPTLPDEPAFAPLRALLTVDGAPLAVGAPLARPALAQTLGALIRDRRALAVGPLADELAATAAAAGGVISAADLAAYQVAERAPLEGRWRGHRLATMPIPSSGGVVLLEALAIIDGTGVDLARLGAGSPAALHVIVEALKHGFADRARALGDTAVGRAAAQAMLAPARLTALARAVALDRTQPAARYGEPAPVITPGPGGTSHICVVDRDGNAVSLTTTVNGYYGAKLVTPGGVVLNNQIDDFAVAVDVANMYGLRQGVENLVGPGKRPLSSMTPVLVLDGDRVVGCVGGSGGPRIISNTLQVLLDLFVFGLDPAAAVAAPRIHHQWQPDALVVEPELPAAVRRELAARGHHLEETGDVTAVQAIVVGPAGAVGASDPRKNGARAAAPR